MFTRFFRNGKQSPVHRRTLRGAQRRASRRPPALETLEDRCLLSWLAGGTFPAGQSPGAVAVGNFRGTEQDVAVIDGAGTVNVLLGDGHGHFQNPVAYRVGDTPSALAVADLRGNGISDLIVTNRASDTVSVLLGNGDGTFQSGVDFPTGGGPRSVAVGDFNGDGIPDLAVTSSSGANAVDVLLGNGDGSFQAPVAFPVGFAPISVAAAPLTASGHVDLVVANELDKTVSVLLGNGDGTFQNAVNYDTGAGSFSDAVVVGDFNGDGVADIAVANDSEGLPNGTGFVGMLLGNGDGTFQPAASFMLGDPLAATLARPVALTVGDFDGNGTPDLVTANRSSSVPVSLLPGNGDGTFGRDHFTDFPFFFVRVAAGVAAADFTGGGRLDLAVTDEVDHTLKLLLNTGPAPSAGGGSSPGRVAPAAAAVDTLFGSAPLALSSTGASGPQAAVSAVEAAPSVSLPETAPPTQAQQALVDTAASPDQLGQGRARAVDALFTPSFDPTGVSLVAS